MAAAFRVKYRSEFGRLPDCIVTIDGDCRCIAEVSGKIHKILADRACVGETGISIRSIKYVGSCFSEETPEEPPSACLPTCLTPNDRTTIAQALVGAMNRINAEGPFTVGSSTYTTVASLENAIDLVQTTGDPEPVSEPDGDEEAFGTVTLVALMSARDYINGIGGGNAVSITQGLDIAIDLIKGNPV